MTESVTQALTDRFKEKRRKDMQEEAFRTNYEGPIATSATPSRAEVIGDYFGNFLQKLGLGATSANEMNRRTTKAAGFSGVLNSMDAIDKGNYGEAAENLVGGPGGGMLESMFIGAGAKNAPSLFLKPAMEDLNAGVPKKKVWEDWGWFAGKDGAMKTEISDRTADLNKDAGEWPKGYRQPFKPKEEARLPTVGGGFGSNYDPGQLGLDRGTPPLSEPSNFGTLFKHDNLFEAYPEVGKADYQARSAEPGQYSGVYYKPDEDSPHGTIKAAGARPTPEGFKKDPKDVVGVSLHEAQHAIQDIEGWGRGGNPSEAGLRNQGLSMKLRARDELKQMEEDGVDAADPRYQQLVRIASTRETSGGNEVPYLGYLSLAGETEARNVQTRRDFTGPERRAKAPWETEDIPRDYQLYRSQDHPFKSEDALIGENVLRGHGQADASPPTRDDLAAIKAPAVHTGGNQSTIDKIYEHAAEQRTPSYPEAKEPVFTYAGDGGLAETKDLVPQVSIRDRLPPKPEEGNFPGKGRAEPIHANREALAALLAGDLSRYVKDPNYKPQQFYSTGPVIRGLSDIAGLSPEEGSDFMSRWSGQGAATSPRTKTPPNLRNSSYLLHRQAIGDPLTPEKHAAEGNRPGFPMMGMHTDLADKFARGTNDLWNNPKPGTFRENWAGNLQDVTADTHYIRATLDALDRLHPGTLPRQWFNSEEAFKRYTDAGGFPKSGELPVGDINDKLMGAMIPGQRKAQTEYGVMAEPGYLAAQKLGITPAEAQAAMWFVNGPRTGLRSPAMTIPDLLNAQIEATARATGLAPEKILKLWSTGAIPLASNETPGQQGTSGLA